MFGTLIGPPNGSHAPKPVSSHTMNSTLGEPSGALGCSYGSQSGVESLTSRLMTPLNGLLLLPLPPSPLPRPTGPQPEHVAHPRQRHHPEGMRTQPSETTNCSTHRRRLLLRLSSRLRIGGQVCELLVECRGGMTKRMTGLPEEPQEAREGGPRLQAVAQGMQMTAAGGFYLITFISAIP